VTRHSVAFALLACLLFASPAPALAADTYTPEADSADNTDLWYPLDEDGAREVALYFVYSETCPHCARAKPVVEDWADRIDWLQVEMVSVQTASAEEADRVLSLAEEINEDIVGVPTFLFCQRIEVGFDSAETTGAELEQQLAGCYDALEGTAADLAAAPAPATTVAPSAGDDDLRLPVLGKVNAETVSLPVFTIAVAGLDAFNPCAFFVLLFLLSLLVHARSRWRMALVGGVFVVISGVMYFAFMAAWLNVFLVTGQLRWVTMAAGLIALTIAIFNVKDFFFPDTTGSLSIPESAKPGLFARMRRLTTGDALPTVLLGTIALAAVANAYELLCTAGFPLVFTRVLTLNELGTSTYYAYLVLYNLVYVVPLLVIVGVFVWTLGSRKLSENEGQFLKLMSGMMMLGLGLLLVFKPNLLENMLAAVGILALAVAVAFIVTVVTRIRDKGRAASV
jgi:thiol-disulfide isomerase/thioredoxin